MQLAGLQVAAHQHVDQDGHEEHQVEEHRADAHQRAEHQRGRRVARACRAREQEERDYQLHGTAGKHQRALRGGPAAHRHQRVAQAEHQQRAEQLDARHRQEPRAFPCRGLRGRNVRFESPAMLRLHIDDAQPMGSRVPLMPIVRGFVNRYGYFSYLAVLLVLSVP